MPEFYSGATDRLGCLTEGFSLRRLQELARSEYAGRRENIIAVGPPGTGKSHIGLGLGLAACQKGLSVGFVNAAAWCTS